MNDSTDLDDWLRLCLVPGIGPERQRSLLANFGPPTQIFAAGRTALAAVIGDRLAAALLSADNRALIDRARAWSEEPGNAVLTLADAAYPQALLETSDPPSLIYIKGRAELLNRPALAIVGARNASPQGEQNAEAFARALSEEGISIVSGLALGIDTAAHRGALAAVGSTIAIVGTGADRIYPARNAALARQIAETGVILSEFPLGTAPSAHNFPRRNRIIAGLARGVLIVEAALESGSLITARLAVEQGREVLAIPGSIHSPLARGCHKLIKDGAKLVESAQDVLEEMHWLARTLSTKTTPTTAPSSDEEAEVLAKMGYDPVDADTLATRAVLTPDALFAILTMLELDGRIQRLPGNKFQRIN